MGLCSLVQGSSWPLGVLLDIGEQAGLGRMG
jgi:hypothetical protein